MYTSVYLYACEFGIGTVVSSLGTITEMFPNANGESGTLVIVKVDLSSMNHRTIERMQM